MLLVGPGRRRAADGVSALALAARGAVRARTAIAQEAERVVARPVAVRPVRRDGVIADQVQVGELDLLRRQRRCAVEPARHAGLAAAVGARAEPAECLESVDSAVTV